LAAISTSLRCPGVPDAKRPPTPRGRCRRPGRRLPATLPGGAGCLRQGPALPGPWSRNRWATLLHVPPVLPVEQPGKEREHGQEKDHPDTDALAPELGHSAGVRQASGEDAT